MIEQFDKKFCVIDHSNKRAGSRAANPNRDSRKRAREEQIDALQKTLSSTDGANGRDVDQKGGVDEP